MNKLLKSGTLITSTETFVADLLIEDEKISRIGRDLQQQVEKCEKYLIWPGKFVLPGGVDAHVHLDLPMFGTVSSDAPLHRYSCSSFWRHNDGHCTLFLRICLN